MVLLERNAQRAALLCVGAVSRNTVDAVLELVSLSPAPIQLIVSRNQIDHASIGVGYVGRWSPESFVEYVRQRVPLERLSLGRDHAGPWQQLSEVETGLDESEAMSRALDSSQLDIDCGFDTVHLDCSGGIGGPSSIDVALERLIWLYVRLLDRARSAHRTVTFEISVDVQERDVADAVELDAMLLRLYSYLSQRGLPMPHFLSTRTGTKVEGTCNTGLITAVGGCDELRPQLSAIVAAAGRFGMRLKAHNCDYLDRRAWSMLAAAGVGAMNVAPELGTLESRLLVSILERQRRHDLRDRFLELAYASGRWRRWVRPDVATSDYERAILAGHYVFSSDEFQAIREEAGRGLVGGVTALDTELRDWLRKTIAELLVAATVAAPAR